MFEVRINMLAYSQVTLDKAIFLGLMSGHVITRLGPSAEITYRMMMPFFATEILLLYQ